MGTNGWYSTKVADTICTLIETKNCYIVLDAGEGFRRLDEYITKDLPVYVFLSHLHLDHIYGLHILPKMKFKDRLTVVVPKSKLDSFLKIIGPPFTMSLKNTPVKIVSIEPGKANGLPFDCGCFELIHQDGSFGYRIDLEKNSVSYCSDTAYDKKVIKFIGGSDILIHECTNKSNFKDSGWGHSNPQEAARIAKEAGVGKLILTHFMPDFYPTLRSRKMAQESARKIFKNSLAAKDGLTIKF